MRKAVPAGSRLVIGIFFIFSLNGLASSARTSERKNAHARKTSNQENRVPFKKPIWLTNQAPSPALTNSRTTSAATILWEDDFEGSQAPWTPVASWTNTPVRSGNPDAGFVFGDHSGWARVDTIAQEPPSPKHAWRNDDNENTAIDLLISPIIHLPRSLDGEPLLKACVRFYLDLHAPDVEFEGNLQDFYYVRAGRATALWKFESVAPFSGSSHWALHQSPIEAQGAFNVQSIATPEINLAGAVNPALSFVQLYATEPNFDYCAVDLSTDQFATYKTLARYSGIRALYSSVALNLRNYAGKKIRLRFRFISDFGFSQPNARWFLDDIAVKDGTRVLFSDNGGDDGRTTMTKWGFAGGDAFIGLDFDKDAANPAALWVERDSTSIDRGSLNILDSAAGLVPGDSIRLAFHWVTNGSLAQGNGRGIFIDEIALEAITGVADDVAMIDLDVPFPNVEMMPAQQALVRVGNHGSHSQNAVPVRYRLDGGPALAPSPPLNFDLASASEGEGILNWKTPGAGIYTLSTQTELAHDTRRANDTLSVAPVVVYPHGIAELGYDDRFHQNGFVTGSKSLVSFTVNRDLRGGVQQYTLHQVKVDLFNGSNSRDQVRLVVATASNDTTVQTILFDGIEPVPARDFSSHVLQVNARDLTAERLVVLVDFSVSHGNARLLMDGGTRFTGHNFFFDGKRWSPSSLGRQIRARLSWLPGAKIILVRDLPADQGRRVQVSWFPSSSEAFSRNISHYALWRGVKNPGAADSNFRAIEVPSMPALYEYGIQNGKPGDRVVVAGNAAWDFLVRMPASPGLEAYSLAAPTLNDSNFTGMNYTAFMVTAYDGGRRFADAKIDSGYSVDNLAPSVPAGFTAARILANQRPAVRLQWRAVADEDLAHYALYKNGSVVLLAITTDLAFTDLAVTVGEMVSYAVTAVDMNGNPSARANVSLNITRLNERSQPVLPAVYELGNNYPNPFNPQTTIEFSLPLRGHVRLGVFNFLGQEIETLIDAEMPAGFHRTIWEAKAQPSGIYFYRLTVNDFRQIKKMVLMQ